MIKLSWMLAFASIFTYALWDDPKAAWVLMSFAWICEVLAYDLSRK